MNNVKVSEFTFDKKPATIKFDKRRLSELVQAAAGERTISQYSDDSGLNRGLIGNIINEKLNRPPSRSSLYKLANPITAKPQNGVKIEALLDAAGYGHDNIPISLNMGKGSLKIQDAIAASYMSSPTHSISMFLDLLIETNSLNPKRNVDIGMRGAWFWLKDIDKNTKYIVIPAFCNHESGAESMMLTIPAMLLDTISTEESVKEPEKSYTVEELKALLNAYITGAEQ